jgi:hypothetical protein
VPPPLPLPPPPPPPPPLSVSLIETCSILAQNFYNSSALILDFLNPFSLSLCTF